MALLSQKRETYIARCLKAQVTRTAMI